MGTVILKILVLFILMSSSLVSAQEIKTKASKFSHFSCLRNKTPKLSGDKIRLHKLKALETLQKMNVFNPEKRLVFHQLPLAYQNLYNKLSTSVRVNGSNIFSNELDRQLDLAGSCESVNSLLLEIRRIL